MRRWILLSVSLCLLLPLSASAQVRQLGLQEIVKSSARSFVGVVKNVHCAYDENQDIVTYTTFTVEEQVTGTSPKTITIKQIGGVTNGLDTRLQHIRYFNVGERVLVSMYGNSELGFSNPVGLDQGVWSITKSGMVQGVTPVQLRGLASVLPKAGLSPSLAQATAAQIVSRSSFTALMKTLAAAPTVNEGGAR